MSNNIDNIIKPKVRNSNLELYRIIVMMLIVMHHYVVNSGYIPLMDSQPFSFKSIYLYWLGMWGKTGINCFVLITGYFMCKSHITLRKFLKLLLEIEFYNVLLYLIFVLTGYIDFSTYDFLWRLFPIHGVSGDFISCYLVFFLFIPFLNVLVSNMNKTKHLLLVVLCLGVYSLYNAIPGVEVGSNDSIWFCILYFISSFIRCYPLKKDKDTCFWIIALFGSVLTAMASVFLIVYFKIPLDAYVFVGWPSAPLSVLISIIAFMLFKDLRIKQNKFINVVGGGTFGVLLIHANSNAMRQWLWYDVFDNVGHYMSNEIYLHAVFVPIIVFSICSFIEYIRAIAIEKPMLDVTYKTIRKYFPTINH